MVEAVASSEGTGSVLDVGGHVSRDFKGTAQCVCDEVIDVRCAKSDGWVVLNAVISTLSLGTESTDVSEREAKPLVMLLLVLRCVFSVSGSERGRMELSNTESVSPSSPSASSTGCILLAVGVVAGGVVAVLPGRSQLLRIYGLIVGAGPSSGITALLVVGSRGFRVVSPHAL